MVINYERIGIIINKLKPSLETIVRMTGFLDSSDELISIFWQSIINVDIFVFLDHHLQPF